MAVTVKELKEWLATLPETELVGIDEGGLILETELSDAYIEIGGFPDEEDKTK